MQGDASRYPRIPPILSVGLPRILLVGDSTLWGCATAVKDQGDKRKARDVCTYPKSRFCNLAGHGLWGKGIEDILCYVRHYVSGYSCEEAVNEETWDTGIQSSTSEKPLWE